MRKWRNWNPHTLLVGEENGLAVPRMVKHEIILYDLAVPCIGIYQKYLSEK